LADEIVDSFHDYDKKALLDQFKQDTFKAIEEKISLNPVLNSFQATINHFNIEEHLINLFLQSMEMDLYRTSYDPSKLKEYIVGSAEVVGLMCLRVFCKSDDALFMRLKPYAMSLGSAFQKVNFLRDLNADFILMGRTYFPGVELNHFDEENKRIIEDSILHDFNKGYEGIRQLPRLRSSRSVCSLCILLCIVQ
jgi:phytoene/squalene synthetase